MYVHTVIYIFIRYLNFFFGGITTELIFIFMLLTGQFWLLENRFIIIISGVCHVLIILFLLETKSILKYYNNKARKNVRRLKMLNVGGQLEITNYRSDNYQIPQEIISTREAEIGHTWFRLKAILREFLINFYTIFLKSRTLLLWIRKGRQNHSIDRKLYKDSAKCQTYLFIIANTGTAW